jgi:hypothetical protein
LQLQVYVGAPVKPEKTSTSTTPGVVITRGEAPLAMVIAAASEENEVTLEKDGLKYFLENQADEILTQATIDFGDRRGFVATGVPSSSCGDYAGARQTQESKPLFPRIFTFYLHIFPDYLHFYALNEGKLC